MPIKYKKFTHGANAEGHLLSDELLQIVFDFALLANVECVAN